MFPTERTEDVFGATPGYQRNVPARGRRESPPRPRARFRQEICRSGSSPPSCCSSPPRAGGSIGNIISDSSPEREVEQLAELYKNIGTGKPDRRAPEARRAFEKRAAGGSRLRAVYAARPSPSSKTTPSWRPRKFREAAEDGDLPKPYRDVALIRQTALEFDALKPEEVIARLQPLAKPGEPWFGSAGEMTALAMIKQGKKAEAGRLLCRDRQRPNRSGLDPRPRCADCQ